ncbi:hypothetical protein Btru_038988 [Bulinus truncatus]|nr:hypothetical protein Btru_038988 [Bulinus truncatus]
MASTPFDSIASTPFDSTASTQFDSIASTTFDSIASTPFDSTASTQFDSIASTPFDSIASTPFDSIASTPFDSTASTPFDSIASTPFDSIASTPFDSTASTPFDSIASTPFDSIASTPFDSIASTPFDSTASTPFDGIASTPFDSTASTPFDSIASTPFDSIASTPFDSTASTPFDSTASTPFEGIASTPFDSMASTPFDSIASTPFDSTASTQFDSIASTTFDSIASTPFDSTASTQFDSIASTPFDSIASTPFDSIASTPFDSTASTPFDSIASTPFDSIASTPFDSTASTPFDSIASTPFDSIASTPFDSIASTPFDSTASTPFDSIASTPFDSIASTPFDSTASTPFDSIASTPFDSIASTPFDSTASTPFDSIASTPFEGIASTPFDSIASTPFDSIASTPFDTGSVVTKGNSTSGNDLFGPTSKNFSDVSWLNATRRLLTNEAIKGRLTTNVTPKQRADIDEEAEGEPDMGRVMQTNFTGVNVTYKTEAETSSQSPLADDRDTKEQTPPHVTEPLSHEMYIVTKNFEQINCIAEGHPEVSYTWYRNDVPLNETGQYIKAHKNGSLQLIEFSKRESGYFMCRARNILGVSMSAKFPIFREIKPEGSTHVVQPISIQDGEPLNLTCSTSPSLPEYSKRWYHKDKTNEVRLTDRVEMDINGTLRFAFVNASDTGTYRCGLIPVKDVNAIYLFEFLDVVVTPFTVVGKKPKLEFSTKKVKGHIGKMLHLECFFSGHPVPNIEWTDNKNQKVDQLNGRFKISKLGRRLTIENLAEYDEGQFTCKGLNSAGEQTETIDVNVTSPPLRMHGLQSLSKTTVPDSKNVTLNCTARAALNEQLNTPVWYRNGEPLTKENLPDVERYSFNREGNALTIRNLKLKEDTACYQCNISNSEGYLFYDGYLRVIQSIQVKAPASLIEVTSAAGQIDLTVLATADPCCSLNYVMKLNGTEMASYDDIYNGNHVISYIGDCNLKINIDNSTQEWTKYMGVYTCEISNLYDRVTVSMQVVHRELSQPERQQAAEASSNLWLILLVCGLLVLIIAVVIIVVVIKTNFPRNSYPLEKTELKHHLNPEEDLLNQSFQEI